MQMLPQERELKMDLLLHKCLKWKKEFYTQRSLCETSKNQQMPTWKISRSTWHCSKIPSQSQVSNPCLPTNQQAKKENRRSIHSIKSQEVFANLFTHGTNTSMHTESTYTDPSLTGQDPTTQWFEASRVHSIRISIYPSQQKIITGPNLTN